MSERIVTRVATDDYRAGYDAIWGKRNETSSDESVPIYNAEDVGEDSDACCSEKPKWRIEYADGRIVFTDEWQKRSYHCANVLEATCCDGKNAIDERLSRAEAEYVK